MTNESNFPAVFFEDFLAALRKVQDENRIHGNVWRSLSSGRLLTVLFILA